MNKNEKNENKVYRSATGRYYIVEDNKTKIEEKR